MVNNNTQNDMLCQEAFFNFTNSLLYFDSHEILLINVSVCPNDKRNVYFVNHNLEQFNWLEISLSLNLLLSMWQILIIFDS